MRSLFHLMSDRVLLQLSSAQDKPLAVRRAAVDELVRRGYVTVRAG